VASAFRRSFRKAWVLRPYWSRHNMTQL
jgi:hypothetical protein